MMMLKFGRLVDLEKLENVTVNRTVEELKEKLRQEEVTAARDVAKWDVSATTCIYLSMPFFSLLYLLRCDWIRRTARMNGHDCTV
jgi:hypothetical protein